MAKESAQNIPQEATMLKKLAKVSASAHAISKWNNLATRITVRDISVITVPTL